VFVREIEMNESDGQSTQWTHYDHALDSSTQQHPGSLASTVNSVAHLVSSLSPTSAYPPISLDRQNEAFLHQHNAYSHFLPLQSHQLPAHQQSSYGIPTFNPATDQSIQSPPLQQQQQQQHTNPHFFLQNQIRNAHALTSSWEAEYGPLMHSEKTDYHQHQTAPKRTYTKRKETTPKAKDTPKEGSRLHKQLEEIETTRKALREPLLSLIQLIDRLVPAIATYPNSDGEYLSYYLPCGTDVSKTGMQQQNRNPVLPYVFYKSMDEDIRRLFPETIKTCAEGLSKYINKYRHRHVNNRRKHLSSDLQVSQFEKSPAQLNHETNQLINLEEKKENKEQKDVRMVSVNNVNAIATTNNNNKDSIMSKEDNDPKDPKPNHPKTGPISLNEKDMTLASSKRKRRRCLL